MTTDEIIQMAREAGVHAEYTPGMIPLLERFAALVAEKEREACAKVAESLDDWCNDPYETATIREIAALIRSRSSEH